MGTFGSLYEFTVHVTGVDLGDESQFAKWDDPSITLVPFTSEGLAMLAVEMKAQTPESALSNFKLFLTERSPEVKIKRVDLDLVSLSQIAERLDVTREAVRLWARGHRRHGFPEPFTSAGQSLLWAWSEVYDWLSPEETEGDAHPLSLNLIERTNGSLARERTSAIQGGRRVAVG